MEDDELYNNDLEVNNPTYQKRKVEFSTSRLIFLGNGKYRLVFSSKEDIDEASLFILLSGELQSYKAKILSCINCEDNSKIRFTKNQIFFKNIVSNKKYKIDFLVDSKMMISLEVALYDSKI